MLVRTVPILSLVVGALVLTIGATVESEPDSSAEGDSTEPDEPSHGVSFCCGSGGCVERIQGQSCVLNDSLPTPTETPSQGPTDSVTNGSNAREIRDAREIQPPSGYHLELTIDGCEDAGLGPQVGRVFSRCRVSNALSLSDEAEVRVTDGDYVLLDAIIQHSSSEFRAPRDGDRVQATIHPQGEYDGTVLLGLVREAD